MNKLVKTNASDRNFIALVKELDAYLTITDGDEHEFYHQYNGIDDLKFVVLIYEEDNPVACGAIKPYNDQAMEVKRMYVVPEFRRKGLAAQVLEHLESWTKDLGYTKCILETGKRQVEAVAFYNKVGYLIIPNYGQYKGIVNSVCFEKMLI